MRGRCIHVRIERCEDSPGIRDLFHIEESKAVPVKVHRIEAAALRARRLHGRDEYILYGRGAAEGACGKKKTYSQRILACFAGTHELRRRHDPAEAIHPGAPREAGGRRRFELEEHPSLMHVHAVSCLEPVGEAEALELCRYALAHCPLAVRERLIEGGELVRDGRDLRGDRAGDALVRAEALPLRQGCIVLVESCCEEQCVERCLDANESKLRPEGDARLHDAEIEEMAPMEQHGCRLGKLNVLVEKACLLEHAGIPELELCRRLRTGLHLLLLVWLALAEGSGLPGRDVADLGLELCYRIFCSKKPLGDRFCRERGERGRRRARGRGGHLCLAFGICMLLVHEMLLRCARASCTALCHACCGGPTEDSCCSCRSCGKRRKRGGKPCLGKYGGAECKHDEELGSCRELLRAPLHPGLPSPSGAQRMQMLFTYPTVWNGIRGMAYRT